MGKTDTKSTRHPEREEILRAVRVGTIPFRSHLEQCEHCRAFYKFVRLRHLSDTVSFVQPSPAELSKHAALPFLVGNWIPRKAMVGRTVRDSWNGLPTVALRDAATGMERRLHFSAGLIKFELVANRSPEGWRFVARVYRGVVPLNEYVLKVGRTRLQPGLHDCFYWTANKPPRKMQLLSPSLRVDIDVATW